MTGKGPLFTSHAPPPSARYFVAGPTSGPNGQRPMWAIVDKQAPQPGSKIVKWVTGRDEAIRQAKELNEQ